MSSVTMINLPLSSSMQTPIKSSTWPRVCKYWRQRKLFAVSTYIWMQQLSHDCALVTEVVKDLCVNLAIRLPIRVDGLHGHHLSTQLACPSK